METQPPTIEEAIEQVTCGCINCISEPLSVLQLEVDKPLAGWEPLLEQLEIRQVVDHLGRAALTAVDARRLLSTMKRQGEFAAEGHALLAQKVAARHPVKAGGVPVQEGMNPVESMVAAGVVSLQDEFGSGRERPDFLREELAAGQRAEDEKKQLAADRAKQRLLDQAKDKLR